MLFEMIRDGQIWRCRIGRNIFIVEGNRKQGIEIFQSLFFFYYSMENICDKIYLMLDCF